MQTLARLSAGSTGHISYSLSAFLPHPASGVNHSVRPSGDGTETGQGFFFYLWKKEVKPNTSAFINTRNLLQKVCQLQETKAVFTFKSKSDHKIEKE
jgi:hypothetical protein